MISFEPDEINCAGIIFGHENPNDAKTILGSLFGQPRSFAMPNVGDSWDSWEDNEVWETSGPGEAEYVALVDELYFFKREPHKFRRNRGALF